MYDARVRNDTDYFEIAIWVVPIAAGLAVGARFALARWWRARGADNWPQTTATVETGAIGPIPREVSRGVWLVEVPYSYSVAGEYYAGFIQQQFFDLDTAERFAAGFPSGRKLTLRYRQDNPEISVVLPQDQAAQHATAAAISPR